jgi:hypothetical protein
MEDRAPDMSRDMERGLDFLLESQLASGQFPMEFTRADPATGTLVSSAESSPFSTSYIVDSLGHVASTKSEAMIGKAVAFLEREKVRGGLWRYWCKDAPLHSQIPPDVDDTACISGILRQYGNGNQRNEAILLANRNDSGLFHTWIVPRRNSVLHVRWWWVVLTDVTYGRLSTFWHAGARRDDVDSVVNANVLRYLGARRETLPVIRWLNDIATERREAETDKWYRSRPAFYHALSRCHSAGVAGFERVCDAMTQSLAEISQDDGSIGGDPLQTAMAVSALLNFGIPMQAWQRSLDYLAESQRSDGGWDAFPIYYDGRPEPQMSWSSRQLTTAFCLEVLSRTPAPAAR